MNANTSEDFSVGLFPWKGFQPACQLSQLILSLGSIGEAKDRKVVKGFWELGAGFPIDLKDTGWFVVLVDTDVPSIEEGLHRECEIVNVIIEFRRKPLHAFDQVDGGHVAVDAYVKERRRSKFKGANQSKYGSWKKEIQC